jgi:plastocyanin
MKRTWIIIGALAVLIVGGLLVWMQFGAKQQRNGSTPSGDSPSASDVTDRTDSALVVVAMKNTAFTPQKIKVKKGTTVRWVNEDDVRHNVVALNENDQSGLPAQNDLLGKGGTYEYRFDILGTFDYKCSPHPFMTGSVEVVQ